MPQDQGLEQILVNLFEIDHQKAEKTAENLTLAQFELNFTRLESIVGFEHGIKVVKSGEFLDYRNGQLENYLQLAMTVRSKMNSSLPIPIEVFYSIESLKTYLGIKEKREVALYPSKSLDVAKYRLLHSDNSHSRAYLDSLIKKGEITVGREEHWNKSPQTNGPRGLNIVRKIAYELTLIFNYLGLGRPAYDLNHGQMKLTITDPAAREHLRQIREKVYALQK